MTDSVIEQDIPLYVGENLRLPLAFSSQVSVGAAKTPVNLTGDTVSMTIAWPAGPSYLAGSVTKSSPASGITITSAPNGTAEALFSVSDLAPVPLGRVARWQVKIVFANADASIFGAGYIVMRSVP